MTIEVGQNLSQLLSLLLVLGWIVCLALKS